MLRTDRKTEPARETAKEQKTPQRRQSREAALSPAAAALEALLAGAGPERLPAEGVLDLSRTVGNSALLELIAARRTGPETAVRPLPEGPCTTAPADWSGSAATLTEAPVFGAMAPMGAAAPLVL